MAALQVSEANLNRSESGWSAAPLCCQTLGISIPSPGVYDRFGSFAGPTQPTASPDVRFRSKSVGIWIARKIDAECR
jgi:hypothetical protein